MSQIGLNSLNTNPALHDTSSPNHPTTIHNSNATVQSGLTEASATPRRQQEVQTGNEEPGLPPTPPIRSLAVMNESINEAGYDSDGHQGLFYEGLEGEGRLIVDDEEEVGVVGNEISGTAENSENPVILVIDMVDKMKVVELES